MPRRPQPWQRVSLADLIVLGGVVGVEQAAKAAGQTVMVPLWQGAWTPRRRRPTSRRSPPLEPVADGFRNFRKDRYSIPSEALLIDRDQLLTLSAPEMTVLVGGLRVLGAVHGTHGVLTARPGVLTNDFFVNLLDMNIEWKAVSDAKEEFEGRDRKSGKVKWTGTRVDLVFGSNALLRAVAEVYASADARAQFVEDFVAAWTKVMNMDRFDRA